MSPDFPNFLTPFCRLSSEDLLSCSVCKVHFERPVTFHPDKGTVTTYVNISLCYYQYSSHRRNHTHDDSGRSRG